MKNKGTTSAFRLAVGCAVLVCGAAYGQDASQPAQSPQTTPNSSKPDASADSLQLQEVVVTATGTHIQGIAPVGSESLTITREQAIASGVTDLNSLLQKLPQVQSTTNGGFGANYTQGGTAAYGSAGGNGANGTQGTAVNLRGLGAQATLLLVDGHRTVGTGASSTFSDSNPVPFVALQSVDVVADGNAAIYGSDAVAGVVNYITRRNFEGVSFSPRATFVHGYNEYGGSVTGGHQWESLGGHGNFILNFDYDYRQAMPSSTSPLLSQNLTRYGGIDSRITNGAINGGVGPGQPPGNNIPSGITPYYTSDVAYKDNGAGYVYFGAPAGANATLTTAQLLANPTLRDQALDTDYLGSQKRDQISAFFNQDLTSWLSFYAEGFFTHRETISRGSQYANGANTNGQFVQIQPGNPFYVAPPAPYAAGTEYVYYDTTSHVGNWTSDNPNQNYTTFAGFKGKLFSDWKFDASYTFGRDTSCGICQFGDNVDLGALQHEVDIGAINPYSTNSLTAAQIAAVTGTNVQYSVNTMKDALAKFDGSLFDLPGGTVKAALGMEDLKLTEYIANGKNRTVNVPSVNVGNINEASPFPPAGYQGVGCAAPLPCPPFTQPNQFTYDNVASNDRNVSSGFAEVYVPVIGRDLSRPFIKSLDLDAAVRFDHYSDFGNTTNPKIGLTWRTSETFAIRGSWGTSFRAPALTDDNPFVASYKIGTAFPNGCAAAQGGTCTAGGLTIPTFLSIPGVVSLSNIILLGGTATGLEPEKSHNWSTGFDWTPISGLKLSATYYRIDYTNEIAYPGGSPFGGFGFLTNATTVNTYKSYITVVNKPSATYNPANCVPGNVATYDPKILFAVNAIGIYGSGGNYCSAQVVLDSRITNTASTTTSGLDLNVNYIFDSAIGTWSFGTDVTYIAKDEIQPVAGAETINQVGNILYLTKWRGRGSASWTRGPWSANLFANVVGSYLNNTPATGRPNQTVPAWVTLDGSLAYALSGNKYLDGTRISLSAQNLFDRGPPIVLTGGSGTSAFNSSQSNVFGREVTFQLTKEF